MILLELFWNFLVIGAVSFGGGYGMISLVRETVLGHCWLTESEFLSFIAVSESTPGPLAVNMATFIGASQAGLAGSFVATVGVVLPSFVIILLIAAALHSLMKYAGVNAFLAGVRGGYDPGYRLHHGAFHAGGIYHPCRRLCPGCACVGSVCPAGHFTFCL